MAARGLILLSLLAAACCHSKPEKMAEPPKANGPVWDKLDETQIGVDGTARNAKLGAVLITAEGTLWIDGLDEWPAELDGKRVHVNGTIEKRKDLPVFVSKPGEPQKSGIPVEEGADLDEAATRFVLVRAKWKLAD